MATLTALNRALALSRTAFACLLLVCCWVLAPPPSFALPTNTAIDQLHHKTWTIADGAPADVWALAQGPDGYLWLGTGAGLFRFDGTEFERIIPANGTQFLSIDITALFATPSGDIWIGYSGGGLSRLRNGELVNYEVDNRKTHWMALRFAQDHEGTMWAATERGLMRFDGNDWQIVGKDWNFPSEASNWVDTSSDGTLWVSDGETILYLAPGTQSFQPTGLKSGRAVFAEGKNDRLWVLDAYRGLTSISLKTRKPVDEAPSADAERQFAPNYVTVDADGTVWGTDLTRGGVFRIADPDAVSGEPAPTFLASIEEFGLTNGLSSNISVPLLIDRTDQLWIGTNLGLDRLSRQFFVTESNIPATSRYGYRAIFTKTGEYILDSSSVYRIAPHRSIQLVGGMPGQLSNAFVDSNGTLWAGTRQGLWRLNDDDTFSAVPLPEALENTRINALAEDSDGSLLAIIYREGVFRLSDGEWRREPLPAEARDTVPGGLFTTPDRTVWMSLRDGRLLHIDAGERRLYGRASGLDIGTVYGVHLVDDHLVAIGEFGIARKEGDGFNTLPKLQLPAAQGVTGLAVTPDGQVWLSTISGVVRLSVKELMTAFTRPDCHPVSEIFTANDGLPGVAQQSYSDTASISRDGRIWFTTNHGMAWHDLTFEMAPPAPVPVRVKTVIANGVAFDASSGMRLPKDTTQLSVAYQALNLSSPDRTLFRYRLGDSKQPWVDVDTARLIQFSNLRPGDYELNIEASSEAGVWLGPSTRFSFTIPPAFYQTEWFLLGCIIVGLGLGYLIYLAHVRQVAERIKTRMEGRAFERERIARELHDTLLQGFQGLLLRFQSVADQLPEGSHGRTSLEATLERADDVLQEGRDRVSFLRGESGPVDLVSKISEIARDILGSRLGWSLNVTGEPHEISAQIADDIAQITSEALWNALRHAEAEKVNIEIGFLVSGILVSIMDDGIGIDPHIRQDWRREGHYGLVGMRERAIKLGAKIHIHSVKPQGTEIRLSLPA